ncbi:MAG: crossover junction endodeoxyribonuclease RuvC [Candidatus Peribacteraceae bacterium]|nr:crossover junction endodeoxyribonuclease RuvC [Candidatus Peribacteraceae bacterium]
MQTPPKERRILGIDPGLATTGLGLIVARSDQDIEALDWLTIETKAGTPLLERLAEIEHDLSEYLEEAAPSLVVVERLFFAVNERSALEVAQARGAILLAAAKKTLPILEPTPLELKSCITGDGKADKKQMQAMLTRILSLKETPQPADAADALALAVFGALHQRTLTAL